MEMTRENAKEINERMGTIDNAVKRLLEYRKMGESVFVNFNGCKLYSCDVTMDSAYMEITGQTKAEYDKQIEEMRKKYAEREARKKAEAQAKIPSWIERGKALVYPERIEEWKECVQDGVRDSYRGTDLDQALVLMEKLESGASMEEVKEMFDKQRNFGPFEEKVRSRILHFSKRGPEFYEATADRELSDEEKKVIEDKRKENSLIDKLHNSSNIISDLLNALSMTESWLSIEDIQAILSEEQYKEILDIKRSKLEEHYGKLNLSDDITQEEIKQEIEDEIKRQAFVISLDEKSNFILREFGSRKKDKFTRTINPSELDESKLASVVENAMQKHLDYDKFYSNENLTAEQMPQTLAFYIKIAKECQNRNNEISKTPLQRREEEISLLEEEEKALIDKQAEKTGKQK